MLSLVYSQMVLGINLGLDMSVMGNLFSFPALSAFALPMLDLLIIPELFAVSLLPPVAVFVDAAVHVVFIIVAFTFLPEEVTFHSLSKATIPSQSESFSELWAS